MFGNLLKRLCAISLASLILTNCSDGPVAFGTEAKRETFAQLAPILPTASTRDTEQTRIEVGVFRAVFLAICPDDVCAE